MNLFAWLNPKKDPKPTQQAAPKAMYEGAAQGRRLMGWNPPNQGAKQQGYAVETLRRRARDLYRNNPIARAAVDKLTEDAIAGGVGCRPTSALSEALRARMVRDFEDWAMEADHESITDFYSLQAAVMREMLIAGEVLVILENRPTASGVSLRLRLLEAEHLPLGHSTLSNGNSLIDGVELDPRGKRVAYHIYENHPGDGAWHGGDIKRLSANRVLHIFEARRPGQVRGESFLAPVLVRMKALDEYDDATLERQKLANLFMAFIRRPAPEFDAAGQPVDAPPLNLEPGAVQELLPGEDVTFSEPPGANGYDSFTREQLRRIAAALGIPYFLLSGDYTQVNDRTARVTLTAYRRRVLRLVRGVIVPRFVRPVREAWIDVALKAGMLPASVPRADLMRTEYVPEAWEYVNPVQEVKGEILAIENGLKSRSESLLERGRDIEIVDGQRRNEKAQARRLGLGA